MSKAYDSIYILGGHKLATSYFEKLTRAKAQKQIDFQNLYCVTDDPQAFIYQHAAKQSVVPQSFADFIKKFVLEKPIAANDALVPDHTAKHVMLQACLKIVETDFKTLKAKLTPLKSGFNTPFLHKSENDALWAVSYATWTCPPDCDEPSVCPHTAAKRDWDFNASLKNLYVELKSQNVACYDFACETLFAEICHLPLVGIRTKFLGFKKELASVTEEKKFLVATHSHCHGIMGLFSVTS